MRALTGSKRRLAIAGALAVVGAARRPRRSRVLLGAATVSAVVLGFGIGVAGAADPRLDEADAALQKAQALLESSQSGGVSGQAQHRFQKAVARAIADVEDARDQIAEAKAAVDNP
jgi:hypothetical protein